MCRVHTLSPPTEALQGTKCFSTMLCPLKQSTRLRLLEGDVTHTSRRQLAELKLTCFAARDCKVQIEKIAVV